MISEFVRAEMDSRKGIGTIVGELMGISGLSREDLEHADLSNPALNVARARVLAAARGWPNRALFTGFPNLITWHRAVITLADVESLRYGTATPWDVISDDTWHMRVGAERVSGGLVPVQNPTVLEAVANVEEIITELRQERLVPGDWPPVVAVGSAQDRHRRITFVEGHTRMTAYIATGMPVPLEIIYGETSLAQLETWVFFPSS